MQDGIKRKARKDEQERSYTSKKINRNGEQHPFVFAVLHQPIPHPKNEEREKETITLR